MPTTGLCSRCGFALSDLPADGVCPACGSRLPANTALGESTPASAVPCGRADTASFEGGEAPTRASGEFAAAPPQTAAPTLPNYDELTVIGTGGMGVVYRAVQRATERVVAVKFLHGAGAFDPSLRLRFDTEARALARVRHPHIVQVYEVGDADGLPYFSMEFIPGGTLARRARDEPFAARESARIVAGVAAAVEAAHREQVLHRDIKPSNILLDADGLPKITDFGLAKLADRDDGLTLSGNILGTPSYMAPEQAAGRVKEIDARTDVYGLGATLYELLCGRPPFKGESHAATLQLVQEAEVVPPGRVRAGVPAELEAICLKCLEKLPARRYATAQELADDLHRWLAGEPTRARPLTRRERARRWSRRHRVKLAAALLLIVALTGAQLVRRPNPREAIDRELSAGRPVNLLAETGLPRWHDWPLGAATLERYPNGTCGFQTYNRSLLALASSPDRAYRLVATLRHLSGIHGPDDKTGGSDNGRVGVFWGYDSWPTGANRQAHRFFVAEYNDFPPPNWKRGSPPQRKLYVRAYAHGQEPTRSNSGARDQLLAPFEFVPTSRPSGPGEWRQLVVEVRPGETTIRWGRPTGELVEVGTFTTRHLAKVNERVLSKRLAPTDDTAIPAPPLEKLAGRRLGVWACAATVEVQEYRVEPLTDPPSP